MYDAAQLDSYAERTANKARGLEVVIRQLRTTNYAHVVEHERRSVRVSSGMFNSNQVSTPKWQGFETTMCERTYDKCRIYAHYYQADHAHVTYQTVNIVHHLCDRLMTLVAICSKTPPDFFLYPWCFSVVDLE